jgi:hypothetical protein
MFTKYYCNIFCQQNYPDKETDNIDTVGLKRNFGSGSNGWMSAET